ncbi:TPA: CRISPR-associated endonuclease Cas2 [Candidatus Poribacteria bacterium]|nr:CRISPR-associated endonuclease Cas2 [Candidatus Poribacteria bacterium]
MYYVVAYDIESDRRRNRVMKTLKDFGQRAQYSVFECDTDKKHYLRLKDRLDKLINHDKDSIIFFHLCKKCETQIERIGIDKKVLDKSEYIV